MPCKAPPADDACFIAGGKVRSQGFDAEISGEVLPGWLIGAGAGPFDPIESLHSMSPLPVAQVQAIGFGHLDIRSPRELMNRVPR